MIALQWCVSFCFITKWISYTYTYISISPPSCVIGSQRLSGLPKVIKLVSSYLTPKSVFLVSLIQFQGRVHWPAGLDIRNSLYHLDLSNDGTAQDLLHLVLAHLGKFYSQINSIRLLLNTNGILWSLSFFFFFNSFIHLFWLHWVFVVVRGLSLVAANRGYSSLWCTGSRHAGFSSCGTRAQ